LYSNSRSSGSCSYHVETVEFQQLSSVMPPQLVPHILDIISRPLTCRGQPPRHNSAPSSIPRTFFHAILSASPRACPSFPDAVYLSHAPFGLSFLFPALAILSHRRLQLVAFPIPSPSPCFVTASPLGSRASGTSIATPSRKNTEDESSVRL
jgi:hypothetical protein